MNLILLLASSILVHPVLDDAMEVRLAASPTGGEEVDWFIDGEWVATTASNGATVVSMAPGPHDILAHSKYEGDWRVVVRPDDAHGPGSITYVDAWSGVHTADNTPRSGVPWPVIPFAVGSILLILARRRPKRP